MQGGEQKLTDMPSQGGRAPGTLGARLCGGLSRDVHNLRPDSGPFILEKNEDIGNNRQGLLTMNPLKGR